MRVESGPLAETLPSVEGICVASRYDVLERLGRGGTGEVFLVRDRKTGQEVALKRLWHEHLSKPRITARFAREVQITRKLNHAAIVRVLDAARDGDDLFYTMDYLKGVNLRTWMHRNGTSTVEAAVRVAGMVSRALDHCHRYTIHRDISPENIMLSPDGRITLIDFGLAKRHGCTDGLTIVNTGLGRQEYNAPEQERNAYGVNHRADLYPVGIIFHEMLTHERTPGTRPLSALRPDVGKVFDEFLARTVAADAQDRYEDARTMHDGLLRAYAAYRRTADAGTAKSGHGGRRWWHFLRPPWGLWRGRNGGGVD